jgi:hypothetical protein
MLFHVGVHAFSLIVFVEIDVLQDLLFVCRLQFLEEIKVSNECRVGAGSPLKVSYLHGCGNE